MPPPSPAPGCASGDVWTLRIATRRTAIRGMLPGDFSLRTRRLTSALGRSLGLERPVDLDESLPLTLGDALVAEDFTDEIRPVAPLVEDARTHVQRLARDTESLGNRLEDLGRRFPQSALDLAQIRIG